MTLLLADWDDRAVLEVLQDLDNRDWLELVAAKGRAASAFDLWAEWRQLRGLGAVRVARWDAVPFAVLGVINAGSLGVGQAALVARDHRRWRRGLVLLARLMRSELVAFAAAQDLWRIECRSWVGHPSAASLLAHLGFRLEAELAGFHPRGQGVFLQWAWTRADPETELET